MNIRPARADDLTRIQEIAQAAYAPFVTAIGRKPAPMVADFDSQIDDGLIEVAVEGDTVLGFAVAYPREKAMHLENIAVDPALHGRGTGTALMTHIEETARNIGLASVELYTNEKMTGNLKWYPAIGYCEIGRWEEDGYNRVFFRKNL